MAELFANIIIWMNGLFQNYGITMILFTLLIKLVVLPLDYKSRKSMRRMTDLQPQLAKLQKKYENDKEKLNQKTTELYRKSGVSPLSGCLPMIVSMVILYIMWAGMRQVANEQIIRQAVDMITENRVPETYEGFLWIKNIWMPDSPFHPVLIQSSDLSAIDANTWTKVWNALGEELQNKLMSVSALAEGASAFNAENLMIALGEVPGYAAGVEKSSFSINLLITNLEIYKSYNGFFILPVLSAVTQFVMTATQPASGDQSQQNGTANFMKYFFPLFSLWVCSSFNAMFALYWVVSNIYSWIQTIVLNKIFDRKAATVSSNEEVSVK